MSSKQFADEILRQRGILEVAIEAGWKPINKGRNWFWHFPIPPTLESEKTGGRYKNVDPEANQYKYMWEKQHPSNELYIPFGVKKLKQDIADADGEVWIANGDPTNLVFHSAGIPNVISWFGEKSGIPNNFVELLKRFGVKRIRYPFDNDKTGLESAQVICGMLNKTGIEAIFHSWGEDRPPKFDGNDLWIELNFHKNEFGTSVFNLNPYPIEPPEMEVSTIQGATQKYSIDERAILSVVAEQIIIGEIFRTPELFGLLTERVKWFTFGYSRHQQIMKLIEGIVRDGGKINESAVWIRAERDGVKDKIGSEAELRELRNFHEDKYTLEDAIQLVVDFATKRAVLRYGEEIIRMAYSSDHEIQDVLNEADVKLRNITLKSGDEGVQHIGRMGQDFMEDWNKARASSVETRVLTGFRGIDDPRYFGGFERSKYGILIGGTGAGKTSLANGIGINTARDYGNVVAVVSMEMKLQEMTQRGINHLTGIPLAKLSMRSAKDLERMTESDREIVTPTEDELIKMAEATELLQTLPIFYKYDEKMTAERCWGIARQIESMMGRFDLLIVDLLTNIHAEKSQRRGTDRSSELFLISQKFEMIAKAMNCVVLVLTQQSAEPETKQRAPKVNEISNSKKAGTPCDFQLSLFRPFTYNPEDNVPENAKLYGLKNRGGALPSHPWQLYFDKGRFLDGVMNTYDLRSHPEDEDFSDPTEDLDKVLGNAF